MKKVDVGKLDPTFLEALILSFPRDKRVILGPGVGKDAAVIDFGKFCLAIKTDPITFTSRNLGWYVVNINANDVACVGATPRWFLLTLLLPEKKTSDSLVENIFKEVISACKKLGIFLIGGHTEITHNLDRPIAIGQMIGEVKKEKVVRNSGAREGDIIILTKGIAIEGTYLIYRERERELKGKVPSQILERIRNFLYNPGIGVVKEALLASNNVKVHSMHDPTEGGLMTGLWELAYASRVGMKIDKEKIPILEETRVICKIYRLAPLKLLASGALILTLSPEEGEKLCQIYERENISYKVIGKVVSPKEGVKMVENGKEFIISGNHKDEIDKLW